MVDAPILKPLEPMTADAFMEWYDAQPEGERYELLDGRIYKMQTERAAHGRVKLRVASAFERDIRSRRLPCEAFVDGMAVRIDDRTTFEPDAFVRCGPRLPGDATVAYDPVLVVEVLSPSTQAIDTSTKLTQYFRSPTIIHYLIVVPAKRTAIHHRRGAGDRIETMIRGDGVIVFDPPGLTLDVATLFEDDVD